MDGADAILKRLITLTTLMVAIAVVAFSGLLFRLDAADNRANLAALTALEQVEEIPSRGDIAGNPDGFVDAVIDWLAKTEPDLNIARGAARQGLLDWLSGIEQLPIDALVVVESPGTRLPGKVATRGRPADELAQFHFFRFAAIAAAPKPAPPPGYRESVAGLLDKLMPLFADSGLIVVSALTLPALPADTRGALTALTLPEPYRDLAGSQWYFEGAGLSPLDRMTIVLRAIGGEAVADLRAQQRTADPEPLVFRFGIEAETRTVVGPRYFDLARLKADRHSQAALERLAADPERRALLRARFGFLPVQQAVAIARGALAESHKSISVLGFKFSPQRFPLAVGILFAALLVGIWRNVETARRQHLRLAAIQTDRIAQMPLDHDWSRLLVWAVLPPLAVAAAAPFAPVGVSALVLQTGAMLVLLIGGLGCYLRADPLFRRASDVGPS